MPDTYPTTANRTQLCAQLSTFLNEHPGLHLGGDAPFTQERSDHTRLLGWHRLSRDAQAQAPIADAEFTAVRTSHGVTPVTVFYPKSGEQQRRRGTAGAIVYMHGGGYTVGAVDDFEYGLRIIAEKSACQVYAVTYHRAPEYRYPTQLDQYSDIVDWLQGDAGRVRGVHADRVAGAGDSAGGNMTAALALRRKDEGKKNICAQLLLYPEARVPFDTPAAVENNSAGYLECNGIFSFADHYLPRGVPPSERYVSPGMQDVSKLGGLPPTCVFTAGFDPLRDVGVEYAHKLQKAGNQVEWTHHPDLTHGFVQFGPWSERCRAATEDAGRRFGDMMGELGGAV